MLGIAAGTGKRIVQSVWDAIPVDWQPTSLTPLGCGHYGCVYPTADPAIVLKVTTDPTEVAFVQAALSLHGDKFPPGIVRYYRIDATEQLYRGRTAYLIWRESAFDVGAVMSMLLNSRDSYYQRTGREARQYLHAINLAGAVLRDQLKRASDPVALQTAAAQFSDWAWQNVAYDDAEKLRSYRGPQRFAAAAHVALSAMQMLEQTYLFDSIGRTFLDYLEEGLLLADVHHGNIGRVSRDGNDVIVITDPGHMIDLRPFVAARR